MKIFVDIDGTICTQEEDYRNAEPFLEVIERINEYFDAGHIITYWTARGGTSGKDWTYYTHKQLCSWGCKFHFLECGKKPDFDILIDDRARKTNEI